MHHDNIWSCCDLKFYHKQEISRYECYGLFEAPAVQRKTSSRVMKIDKVQGFEGEVLLKD